jgi:hypothetical protein
MRIGVVLLLVFTLAGAVLAQQPPAPPQQRALASPRGQADFAFADGKKIVVDYGRPFIRKRKIMGGLVPFGQVWRTGANQATSFETQTNLDLAGAQVPAGKYTLFTIPGEDSWTIIINKQTGQWGTVYSEAQDLVRVKVKPVKTTSTVEQFTISVEQRGGNAGVMKLEWENTSVPVEFKEAK